MGRSGGLSARCRRAEIETAPEPGTHGGARERSRRAVGTADSRRAACNHDLCIARGSEVPSAV
eukprot:11927160-Alexandrium_andersonii.AAC.1